MKGEPLFGLLTIIGGIISGIFQIALGELIIVFIDIEKNHCCPTKVGFKNSVTLCCQRLQLKNSLFQNLG